MTNNKKISTIAAALLGASQLFTSAAYGETTISRDTPMNATPGTPAHRPAVPTRATCTEDLSDRNVKRDVYIHGVGGGGVVRVAFGYIQPNPQKPEEIEYTGCVYQQVNQRPLSVAFVYDTATERGLGRIQTLLGEAEANHARMCARSYTSGTRPPECSR